MISRDAMAGKMDDPPADWRDFKIMRVAGLKTRKVGSLSIDELRDLQSNWMAWAKDFWGKLDADALAHYRAFKRAIAHHGLDPASQEAAPEQASLSAVKAPKQQSPPATAPMERATGIPLPVREAQQTLAMQVPPAPVLQRDVVPGENQSPPRPGAPPHAPVAKPVRPEQVPALQDDVHQDELRLRVRGDDSASAEKQAASVLEKDEPQEVKVASEGSASLVAKRSPSLPVLSSPRDVLQSLYAPFDRPVLIPIPRGKKRPTFTHWQHTTYEDTQRPEYQRRLLDAIKRGGNIGIRLGPKSGRLFALDIDDDHMVEGFLQRHPWLANTLRSRGKPGCQFWFRLGQECEYPNDKAAVTLKRDGKPYGELRLGGGRKGAQSIIFGIHPDGFNYEHNGKTPLEIGLATLFDLTGWKGQEEQELSDLQADTAAERAGDRMLEEESDAPEEHALAVAKNIEAFYDHQRKEYVLRIARNRYQTRTETQFKRNLRLKNLRAETIPERNWSQIDLALRYFQENKFVDYCGGLAGRNCGFCEENGFKILVTKEPLIITPSRGEWPTVNQLIANLVGGPDEPYGDEQLTVLYGWIRVSYLTLTQHRFQPGQALAIAGPPDSGKSLLQTLITEILGGRSAKAILYLQGRTDFNGELFEAEHLMLEDEAASTLHKDRMALAASIKGLIANRIHPCHPKNRQIVNLAPFWRVTFSLNDRPDRLLVLPPMDEDIADKIILLRASKYPMPMDVRTPEQKEIFYKKLVSELPAFLHFLLNDFELPSEWQDDRFGVKSFHHPDLMVALEELAPATHLLSLIDIANIWTTYDKANGVPCVTNPWQGTPLELRTLLLENPKTQRDANRILGWINACGQYLADLSRTRRDRVTAHRTGKIGNWFKIVKPELPNQNTGSLNHFTRRN
jgi:bifunctional DNA primase/polymerase-like protein